MCPTPLTRKWQSKDKVVLSIPFSVLLRGIRKKKRIFYFPFWTIIVFWRWKEIRMNSCHWLRWNIIFNEYIPLKLTWHRKKAKFENVWNIFSFLYWSKLTNFCRKLKIWDVKRKREISVRTKRYIDHNKCRHFRKTLHPKCVFCNLVGKCTQFRSLKQLHLSLHIWQK